MAGPLVSGPRRASQFRRAYRPMSDINVTPFVDVMLVLLVVFMVTAPLLSIGVPVDLPRTTASPLPIDNEPLFITVQRDGRIFVKETEVSLYTLGQVALGAASGNTESRVLIRGDQGIQYGKMMQVMSTLNGFGFRKLGLVAELPDDAAGSSARP